MPDRWIVLLWDGDGEMWGGHADAVQATRNGASVESSWIFGWPEAHPEAGDRVLLFRTTQNRGVIGRGVMLGGPSAGANGSRVARVRLDAVLPDDHFLQRNEIDSRLRRAKWPRLQHSGAVLDPGLGESVNDMFEDHLRAFLKSKVAATPAPPSDAGHGFASVEVRDAVEQAAMDLVCERFEGRGFKMTPRFKEPGLGWDFDATSPSGAVMHVEVKGTSGKEQEFFLEKSQVAAAKGDGLWLLAVVTEALEPARARLTEYRGAALLDEFDLEPVRFRASRRK